MEDNKEKIVKTVDETKISCTLTNGEKAYIVFDEIITDENTKIDIKTNYIKNVVKLEKSKDIIFTFKIKPNGMKIIYE